MYIAICTLQWDRVPLAGIRLVAVNNSLLGTRWTVSDSVGNSDYTPVAMRVKTAATHVCFPSSSFLLRLTVWCNKPSTMPATVNTPPTIAHSVVMKW